MLLFLEVVGAVVIGLAVYHHWHAVARYLVAFAIICALALVAVLLMPSGGDQTTLAIIAAILAVACMVGLVGATYNAWRKRRASITDQPSAPRYVA